METQTHDVAVIGYGPVGKLAALLLGRRGHRVGVYERAPAAHPYPRAVHYDHEVTRILDAAGIAPELNRIVEPIGSYEWAELVDGLRRHLAGGRGDAAVGAEGVR